MAKKLISFNFNGEFVPELSSLIKTYPIAEINTIYCTSAPSRVPNLNTDTYLAEAIANYVGSIDTMHLFVGKSLKNEYIAEYQKPGKDEIQICIGAVTGGTFVFKAGKISEETGLLSPYEDGHEGTMFPVCMGGEAAIRRDASAYFLIYALSIPAREMLFASQGMIQSSGNNRVPSILNVIMCALDVFFNALLIPKFGVAGAALGTAFSFVIIASVMLYILLVRSPSLSIVKPHTTKVACFHTPFSRA